MRRDDAYHRYYRVVGKAHALVKPMGPLVVAHDMQHRNLAALQLAANEACHEPACKPLTLEIRMSAEAADFAQVARLQSLAGHRDEARAIEKSQVFAELDGAQAKRARMPQRGEFKRLGRVWDAEPHRSGKASRAGNRASQIILYRVDSFAIVQFAGTGPGHTSQ